MNRRKYEQQLCQRARRLAPGTPVRSHYAAKWYGITIGQHGDTQCVWIRRVLDRNRRPIPKCQRGPVKLSVAYLEILDRLPEPAAPF